MNHHLKHLIERQCALKAEAAGQRHALSENIHQWHSRLKWLDRTLSVVSFVKRHPATLLGLGAVLATLIPNRSGKTLLGAYTAIRFLRKLFGIFSGNSSSDKD